MPYGVNTPPTNEVGTRSLRSAFPSRGRVDTNRAGGRPPLPPYIIDKIPSRFLTVRTDVRGRSPRGWLSADGGAVRLSFPCGSAALLCSGAKPLAAVDSGVFHRAGGFQPPASHSYIQNAFPRLQVQLLNFYKLSKILITVVFTILYFLTNPLDKVYNVPIVLIK